MIDVLLAAQLRSREAHYTDRTWLQAELARLITAQEWSTLGGLLVHVALAVAPIAGLTARLAEASALQPLTAAPAWNDLVWVAGELAAQAAALTAPDSDLVAAGLRAAGAVARVVVG